MWPKTDAQARLLKGMAEKVGFLVEWEGGIEDSFVSFRFKRYGWLVRKDSG